MKEEPREEEEELERTRMNSKRLGSFKESKYTVTEEEITYINRHFCLLSASRQNYLLNNKK